MTILGTAALVGCFLTAFASTVVYFVYAPWTASPVGKHIMVESGVLTVVFFDMLMLRVLNIRDSNIAFFHFLLTAAYVALFIAMTWRLVLFARIQIDEHRKLRRRRVRK